MPIEALPEDTTRIISSTLALNDAKSVVKELVDNALDSRATAISIEISANTLDVIQVKDNGTGIDVQDRQLLCRRGCTSKIRTIEDLGRLGGTFLGFRGEALASIVELSQSVTVTTRVDGEVKGSTIAYAASGIISSSSASHPVGTTVRVQEFLTKIPVRRQTALKPTTRTLEAIRCLLFSFAFARPEVRFSLRVLKGRNDKMNWTYAATPNRSLAEAATKIAGKEIAPLCTEYGIDSDECDADIGTDWSINAILISESAEPVKVRNSVQYISIDGRPVSTERATMKEIVKSYKRHIQRAMTPSNGSPVSRPFFAMQIRCPPESYDVNIEPAKDEVYFPEFRAQQLLSLVECLLTRAYTGVNKQGDTAEKLVEAESSGSGSILDDNTENATPNPDEGGAPVPGTDGLEGDPMDNRILRGSKLSNPFTITAMNARIKPKKMDTIRVQPQSGIGMDHSYHSEFAAIPEEHGPIATSVTSSLFLASESSLLQSSAATPPMSPRPGPHIRRGLKHSLTTEDEHEGAALPFPDSDHDKASSQQAGSHEWLTPDTGFRRSLDLMTTNLSNQPLPSPRHPVAPGSVGSSVGDRQAPSTIQLERRWGAGQTPFKAPSKSKSQKALSGSLPPTPPSSLLDQNGLSWEGHLPGPATNPRPNQADNVNRGTRQHLSSRATTVSSATVPLIQSSEFNSELEDIMDFEYRKKATVARQRKLMTSSSSIPLTDVFQRSTQLDRTSSDVVECGARAGSPVEDYEARFGTDKNPTSRHSVSDPHRNRYLKALKDLSRSQSEIESGSVVTTGDEDDTRTVSAAAASGTPEMSPNDPRAYLMRQKRMPSLGKLYRTKSAKLPLESIWPGSGTFSLITNTATFHDVSAFQRAMQKVASMDTYFTQVGAEYHDLYSIDVPIFSGFERTIRKLIDARYPTKTLEEKESIKSLKIEISDWMQES